MHTVTARLITPIMADTFVSAPSFGAGLYGANRKLLAESIKQECSAFLNSFNAKWNCSDIRFRDGVCMCDISCTTRDGLFCHFNAVLIEER